MYSELQQRRDKMAEIMKDATAEEAKKIAEAEIKGEFIK